MQVRLKNTFMALVIAVLPVAAFAGVASDVGNGISDVTTGVGDGVSAVGTGVGNAVTDVGTGVGNAVTGKSPAQTREDNDVTLRVQNAITKLDNQNKIAAGYNLNPTSRNGHVTITGVVKNEADIATIKRAVQDTDGVKSVDMKVKVK